MVMMRLCRIVDLLQPQLQLWCVRRGAAAALSCSVLSRSVCMCVSLGGGSVAMAGQGFCKGLKHVSRPAGVFKGLLHGGHEDDSCVHS